MSDSIENRPEKLQGAGLAAGPALEEGPEGEILFSAIMPCFNEERFIRAAMESLVGEADDFFRRYGELIVVDGGSSDRSREIVREFMEARRPQGLRVQLLNNPHRLQSSGLNIGIKAAKGKYIIKADAHCLYPPNYIQRCLQLLGEKESVNAGGVMEPRPANGTAMEEAICLAFKHPVGVGNARWHLGGKSGYVESVYLGTYPKKVLEEVGLFDPQCLTNQDAEINLRVRKAGGKIYLDSSLKVIYFPRDSLGGLAQQYFRYGRGRAYTTYKHRQFTAWRQVVPVALILGLVTSMALSFWKPIFLIIPAAYLGGLLTAAFLSWPRQKISFRVRLLMSAAFLAMHLSWGAGFLYFFLHDLWKKPLTVEKADNSGSAARG